METAVTILRELWLKRVTVGAFAIVAILIGTLVAYRPSLPPQSRKYEIGSANARILVDTPASQAVEVAPKGSTDLGARANLLANLMAEGDVKATIAKRAHLQPAELLTIGPSAIAPNPASAAQLDSRKANILTTRVLTDETGVQLPIIDVEAQAVDAVHAAALANAAVTGLGEYMDSKAALDKVTDARRLRIRPLGAAQGRSVARGPGSIIALGVTILLFAVLCGALLVTNAMARGWRVASDVEDQLRDVMGDESWGLEPPPPGEEGSMPPPASGSGEGSARSDAHVMTPR